MAETITKLSSFGAKLIENHGIFSTKEEMCFTSEEIESVFQNFEAQKNDEKFVAGFVSCFAEYILENWTKISAEEQSKYQEKILEITKTANFPLNMGMRFSHFVANIYRACNYHWDALLSLIFEQNSEEQSDLLPLLFICVFDTFEESYVNERKSEIVSRCFYLIQKSSVTVQIRLLNVLACVDSLELTSDQNKQLWDTIFAIIIQRPDTLIVINTVLTSIYGDYATIQKQTKPVVDNDEKLAAALRLLFVYTPEETMEIIIPYISKATPELVEALAGDFADTVQVDQLKKIEEYLLGQAGDDKVQSYVALAPLAPYICGIDNSFAGKIVEVLRWTAEADEMAFLRILEYASTCIFVGTRLPFITTRLMKILENDDEKGQKAISVLTKCFKHGLIKTRPDIKGALNKFANVSQSLKAKFVVAVDVLVNSEDFDAYLITPIVDFVRNQLQSLTQTEDVKSACFTLIASIAERDENVPFSLQRDLIKIIPVLLNGEDSSKPPVSHMLYFFAEMAPEIVQKILPDALEKLFDFALKSEAATELRGAVGESLAGIVAGSASKKHLINLVDLIKMFLESGDRNLGISGSTMAIIASGVFEGKVAEDVFLACARAAVTTDYAPLFNSYVEGMRRLADKVVIGQQALDFSMEVLRGFAKVAELEPVSSWYNLRTPLYAVFTMIISSIKDKAAPLFQYFVEILSDCVDAMVDVVFQPILKLFELDLIGEETKKVIIDITAERCLVARSVQLLDFTRDNLVEINDFVKKTTECYEELIKKEDDNEDDVDNDDDEWKSCLGITLLQLNGKGAELSDSIIEEAILDFPPDGQLQKTDDAAKEIARIAKRDDLTDNTKIICTKVIFDFLLLNKQELSAHDIKSSTINDLTDAIKGLIKSNKDIEVEMKRYCSGVRAKLNKLNKLTK